MQVSVCIKVFFMRLPPRPFDPIRFVCSLSGLLFYEQNNIGAFKQIFIEQFQFAVKTYF